jgi:hypothetical protein
MENFMSWLVAEFLKLHGENALHLLLWQHGEHQLA